MEKSWHIIGAKIDIDHDIFYQLIWTISCANHEATSLSVAL
jgi:hypothetical protein